jgi:hypothetical protein
MKFVISLTAFICVLLLLANQVIGSFYTLQVLLNNGNSHYCIDRWNNCCTSTEWNLISSRAYAMAQNQRYLESNSDNLNDDSNIDVLRNSTQNDNNNIDTDRDLKTYRGFCSSKCAGYATGRCLALKCRGYRQRRTEGDGSKSSLRPIQRAVFYATGCDNQKSEMNNLFNNMQHELGPRCKSLLNAPRNMTCYNTDDC